MICFVDDGPRHWWDVFTRRGFRHCFAIGYSARLDAWMLVDWSSAGLIVDAISKYDADTIITATTTTGGRVLSMAAPRSRRSWRSRPALPIYCVAAMVWLLDLPIDALTPWGLFCALRKQGAQEILLGSDKEKVDEDVRRRRQVDGAE